LPELASQAQLVERLSATLTRWPRSARDALGAARAGEIAAARDSGGMPSPIVDDPEVAKRFPEVDWSRSPPRLNGRGTKAERNRNGPEEPRNGGLLTADCEDAISRSWDVELRLAEEAR
jgi:hypothetical protein